MTDWEVRIIGILGIVKHLAIFDDAKSRDIYVDGIMAGIRAASKQVRPEKEKKDSRLVCVRIFY
jgi:hypothetical protein